MNVVSMVQNLYHTQTQMLIFLEESNFKVFYLQTQCLAPIDNQTLPKNYEQEAGPQRLQMLE